MPLIKSIYWNQTNSTDLVYLFPFKDITMGSVLTVNDSQEAYFYKNGTLCDKFTSGRYVLSSANIPILQKVVNLPSGGDSTFKASIWFVSKLDKRDLLWGTGGLRIIDPYFEVPVKMFARGQYGIRITDGSRLLLKFVGTQDLLTTDYIIEQFRSEIIETVKVSLSKYIKQKNIGVNEIGTEYKELSRIIADEVQVVLEEYGVEILNFNIEDISIDESDKGYQTVMEGIAERAKLKHLGVDYIQQKQIDISQTLAANQGAGTFMGVGMGLGVGQQMGQQLNKFVGGDQSTQDVPMSAFYVSDNGKTTGPFKMDKIRDMVMMADIVASTYVYKVGGTEWVRAAQEPEVAQILSQMAPPPPPPPMD